MIAPVEKGHAKQVATQLQFWLAYRSLCPSGWYERWDAQRGTRPVFLALSIGRHDTNAATWTEAGNFPVRLDQ